MDEKNFRRELRKFFKELQKIYPVLRHWKLRFVARYGVGGGFCNRKNLSLDCSLAGMWDLNEGKRLILHEATHVFTGGEHDKNFWNRYEEFLTKWLGSGLNKYEVKDKATFLAMYRK
jgi:predicted metal-dependent hydrolase